jgi:hypothetical protein
MKIFTDLHHAGLFESLRILFEDRLGYELYAPIGEKWFEKGYWNIAKPYGDAPDTINQFLGFDQAKLPEDLRLNELTDKIEDGIYQVYDKFHNKWIKKITFDKFIKTKFDLIIPTIPDHQLSFKDLLETYQPKAKLIFQIGNEGWRPNYDLVKNVMASVIPFGFPKGTNIIFYHQEFDLDIFRYHKPLGTKTIVSIMNAMPSTPDAPLYQEYKAKMPDFSFYSYGGGCEDGSVHSIKELRDKMIMADFIWHLKQYDGFGHIIHNAYALGRPVITKESYYKNKLGGYLLEEDKNYINIESGSVEENIDKIKFMVREDNLRIMSTNARLSFNKLVNYNKEEKDIRRFLEKLK